MATFSEAMRAAREGKRVRPNPHCDWMKLFTKDATFMAYENPIMPARLCPSFAEDTWQIEQSPPREYSFLEAVEMMKKGKWFKSLASGYVFDRTGKFQISEIEGKWVEA